VYFVVASSAAWWVLGEPVTISAGDVAFVPGGVRADRRHRSSRSAPSAVKWRVQRNVGPGRVAGRHLTIRG
jgi:hypothetical protein